MSTALLRTRRALLPALALGAAVGVAGCSGSNGTSGAGSSPGVPTATATVTLTPTSSPSPTTTPAESTAPAGSTAGSTAEPTSTPSPKRATSSAAAVPRCTAADVSVTLGRGDGAAGTTYYPLVMTNTSGHACRSGGYGGVSLVDGHGHQLGAAAVRESTADARVAPFVLIPNAHATATLGVAEALNYPRATCRPAASSGLRVYVPNETHATFVRVSGLTACRATSVSLLHLRPYQPVS